MKNYLAFLVSLILVLVVGAGVVIQPGGSGRLAHMELPDGSEYLVTQQCNWSLEPYTVDFFMRSADGEWGWCYIDHKAKRWRATAIEHDAETETVTVFEGGKPVAHLLLTTSEFWLVRKARDQAVTAPEEQRAPKPETDAGASVESP